MPPSVAVKMKGGGALQITAGKEVEYEKKYYGITR